MDPIPRIHHLEVDIKKDRAKIQNLQQEIDGVKRQLSGHEDIFTHNFGGLDFGSTIPGNLYATFNLNKKSFADYRQKRKIAAELDPVFTFYQDLEEAAIIVGTTMDIPIMQMRDKQTKDVVAKYIERGDTVCS